MEDKQETRGGARPGAGRPKTGTAKVPYTTRIAADVAEYLRSQDNAAAALEDIVRRTKAFKTWKEAQG